MQAVVAADAAAYHTVVQQLYIGYMGRPADTGGLANFSAALAAVGAPTDAPGLSQAYAGNETVRILIDSFGTSEESRQLYGGDTQAFITAVYMSLFNRSPDAEGLAFWSNAIDSGNLTKGNAALSILSGALKNQTAQGLIDANSVRNKVAVGSNFTAALLTPANVRGYTGPAAAAAARALLAGVNGITDVAQYQEAVAQAVAKVSVNGVSALANVQWNIAVQPQLALTDAQGSPISLSGMRCEAVDAATLEVAADCSSVRAKRLGVQQITVMGANAAATVPFTVCLLYTSELPTKA